MFRASAPWTLAPWTTAPWTIPPPPPENRHLGQSPLDNCHPGQLPPPLHPLTEQLPPRTITPWAITLDNSCLELLYYPPDIYTRTITAKSDGNYKLQFFHGCFLFLFHGPIIQFLFSSKISFFCNDNKNNNDNSNKTLEFKSVERYYPVALTKRSQFCKVKQFFKKIR